MPSRRLVLVAIDHASDVDRIIRVAAGYDGASTDVDVIRVVPHRTVQVDVGRGRGALDPHDDRTAGLGARLASMAQPAAQGARLRNVRLRGAPERVIPAYARLHQAILLVVESGFGSSRLWPHGGVVEELARRSPVPVLVVPKRAAPELDEDRPRRIVAAINFSIASVVALRTAIDLARGSGSRLTLVHALNEVPRHMVFSGSEAWEASRRLPGQADVVAGRLRRHASVLGADDVDTAVMTGAADRAILEVAAQRQADIVIIGVPRRGWIDRMAFGSTLRRVLRRATTAVLVVPVTAGAEPLPVVEQMHSRLWMGRTLDRVAA